MEIEQSRQDLMIIERIRCEVNSRFCHLMWILDRQFFHTIKMQDQRCFDVGQVTQMEAIRRIFRQHGVKDKSKRKKNLMRQALKNSAVQRHHNQLKVRNFCNMSQQTAKVFYIEGPFNEQLSITLSELVMGLNSTYQDLIVSNSLEVEKDQGSAVKKQISHMEIFCSLTDGREIVILTQAQMLRNENERIRWAFILIGDISCSQAKQFPKHFNHSRGSSQQQLQSTNIPGMIGLHDLVEKYQPFYEQLKSLGKTRGQDQPIEEKSGLKIQSVDQNSVQPISQHSSNSQIPSCQESATKGRPIKKTLSDIEERIYGTKRTRQSFSTVQEQVKKVLSIDASKSTSKLNKDFQVLDLNDKQSQNQPPSQKESKIESSYNFRSRRNKGQRLSQMIAKGKL